MIKTAAAICDVLEQTSVEHDACVDLNQRFQEIRSLLGSPVLVRQEKINLLDAIYDQIWDECSVSEGISNKEELRTFLPSISSSKGHILLEWVRLYDSYKRGLFAYYDFPVLERTNVDMEKHFGEEKTILYSRCGKIQVAPQVRVRGEYILKELYAGRDEVIEIIDDVSQGYDIEQIKAGLVDLAERVSEETEEWSSNVEGIAAIKRVLNIGKPKNNNENEENENDSDEFKT